MGRMYLSDSGLATVGKNPLALEISLLSPSGQSVIYMCKDLLDPMGLCHNFFTPTQTVSFLFSVHFISSP